MELYDHTREGDDFSQTGPITLKVPPRDIPVPRHLSPEARAWLSMPPQPQGPGYPALDDPEGWRQLIAHSDKVIMQLYLGGREPPDCTISEIIEGEARGFEFIPSGHDPADRRVYLDIHGGGLIMGAGELCKAMAFGTVKLHGVRVISVDYRMPPDAAFPAGLDDCVAFYRMLLRDHDPWQIIVGGGSAGGNLAAATILRVRDEGFPLPAAAVLLSPEVDLTESGDSFRTNVGIDGMGSLMQANLLYAAGHSLTDPFVSPLFGDFAKGFPPTLISAGTRDVFLSNAVRLHRKLRAAEIPAELHILEAAAHGCFGGTAPEERELDNEIRQFCHRQWAEAGRRAL